MRVGQKVNYKFPNPVSSKINNFSGIIEKIYEEYVVIRNEHNIVLKVSYKNWSNIKARESFAKA